MNRIFLAAILALCLPLLAGLTPAPEARSISQTIGQSWRQQCDAAGQAKYSCCKGKEQDCRSDCQSGNTCGNACTQCKNQCGSSYSACVAGMRAPSTRNPAAVSPGATKAQ